MRCRSIAMFRADWIWLALVVALSGCAHQPDMRNALQRQAIELEDRGEKAYLAGNLEESSLHYSRALQLNSKIESSHGIASAMLSLAQIDLDRGRYGPAQAKLEVLLGDRDHLFSALDRADAAARLARLSLLLRRNLDAARLAREARSLCAESACRIEAAIVNLQAQAAMAQGATGEGGILAKTALRIAEKNRQAVEQANSLRLLGQVLLIQNSPTASLQSLEAALAIDKTLGLPAKIAEDLEHLASACDLLGQVDRARAFRNRADSVRRAQKAGAE